jgi:hypothetical protein
MHRWSDDDNLIAYCLYRFGDDVFGTSLHELGDVLGMGFNSLHLVIANYKSISGAGGLDHNSEKALRVFNRCRDLPDDKVRQAGREALRRASGGRGIPLRASESSTDRAALEAELAQALRRAEQLRKQLEEVRRRSR